MKPNEYQRLALRTEHTPEFVRPQWRDGEVAREAGPDHKYARLMHAAMGLCTESAELLVGTDLTNEIEEVGDVLWYAALLSDALGKPFDFFFSESPGYRKGSPLKNVVFYSSEIVDVLKRSMIYGAIFDEDRVVRATFEIIANLRRIALTYQGGLFLAMERNIAKLQKRFPNRFTQELALNRNLEGERKALEGKE